MSMTKRTAALLDELRGRDKLRILFVCLGNICRSPAAEEIFRNVVRENGQEYRWEIDSAGIGSWHIGQLPDKRMRVHATRRGYSLTHHARQVKAHDFGYYDLIVAMDAQNEEDLRSLAPTVDDTVKIVRMADFVDMATRYDYIPDPYYEGAEGFELVLDLLENATANLLRRLS